jgi:hypothetical protein
MSHRRSCWFPESRLICCPIRLLLGLRKLERGHYWMFVALSNCDGFRTSPPEIELRFCSGLYRKVVNSGPLFKLWLNFIIPTVPIRICFLLERPSLDRRLRGAIIVCDTVMFRPSPSGLLRERNRIPWSWTIDPITSCYNATIQPVSSMWLGLSLEWCNFIFLLALLWTHQKGLLRLLLFVHFLQLIEFLRCHFGVLLDLIDLCCHLFDFSL